MVSVNTEKLKAAWEQNKQTITIIGAAFLLTIAILAVRAGSPFVSSEAETANISGNAIIKSDTNASGGQYVEFSAGSTVPGRIAVSSDGNYHDRDDILATAVTMAILAKSGNANKLVYYGHSDHIWDTTASREERMKESVVDTANMWGGFDLSNVYNAYRQTSTAVNALAAEINKSTAADPLWIIGAGPMEVICRAVRASSGSGKQHTRVISHSDWNNRHAAVDHNGCHFDDIPGFGVDTIRIKDQNPGTNRPYSEYHWLRDSDDAKLRWLWDRGQTANKDTFDPSDAGMAYWLVTGGASGGDENSTPDKWRDFFVNGVTVTPPPSSGSGSTPSDDFYTENGSVQQNSTLRVENSSTRTREIYLKFDLSGYSSVSSAMLELRVASDPGEGTISAYTGSHNNWSETNTGNLPSKQTKVATVSGAHTDGETVRFDVTDVAVAGNTLTLVLDMAAGGNDVEFYSGEGAVPPRLVIDGDGGSSEPPPSNTDSAWLEQNGRVSIEFESVPATGDWQKESSDAGHSGSGYYVWRGPDYFNQGGNGTLSYPIKISQSGTYNVYIHSRRDGTGTSDLHNDVWVRIDGGPWEKLFQRGGQHEVWTWDHRVERHTGNVQLAYNLSAGYHTIEFSGRSTRFQIDKLHLSTGGNMTLGTPESPRE